MGPMADGTWQLGTTAKTPDSPLEMMHRFLADSNFASWYKNATIVKKTACSITPRFPVTEPVVGNTIIIGDAAAPAETWVQGSLASAYQAVLAIGDGTMNKYIDWWKESFEFNTPDYFKQLARYPALNMFFSDNELNYLYGLIDNQLVSSISDELLKHTDTIKRDKPEIHTKLKKIQEVSLGDTFKDNE
jgi:flavin-dependent dehydrogenase